MRFLCARISASNRLINGLFGHNRIISILIHFWLLNSFQDLPSRIFFQPNFSVWLCVFSQKQFYILTCINVRPAKKGVPLLTQIKWKVLLGWFIFWWLKKTAKDRDGEIKLAATQNRCHLALTIARSFLCQSLVPSLFFRTFSEKGRELSAPSQD